MEKDPWCRAVLTARMQDQLLEHAPIVTDIVGFVPTPSQAQSQGILAGFPCQVSSQLNANSVRVVFSLKSYYNLSSNSIAKDICRAGKKQGLQGQRSSLVAKFFDIIDKMPSV